MNFEPPPPIETGDDDVIRRDCFAAKRVYPCMSTSFDATDRNRQCIAHDTIAYNAIKRKHPDMKPNRLVTLTAKDWIRYYAERLISRWR